MRRETVETRQEKFIEVNLYEEASALTALGFGIQGHRMRGARVALLFDQEARKALDDFRAGRLVLNALSYSVHLGMVRRYIFAARREEGLDNES